MQSFFNTVNEVLKCGIYIRVSTPGQAKEGFGLETQLLHCEAMVTVKNWELYNIYKDEGISGSTFAKDRKGLSQLIVDARNKDIQAVIFYSLDRIGRKTRIVLDTVEYLHILGVKVVSCRENIDTSTPTGMFVLTVFSGLAELDRQTITARMAEGKKERSALDGEIGGPLPYGYWRVDKKLEKNDEEAEVVRYIFDMKYKGATNKGITESLGKIGYKPPRGNKWPSSTVHKILSKRDIYVGGKRNNSQVCWPQILPRRYKYHQFVRKYKKKENVVEEVNEQARKKGINMDQFPK